MTDIVDAIAAGLPTYGFTGIKRDGICLDVYMDGQGMKLTIKDGLIIMPDSSIRFWVELPLADPECFEKLAEHSRRIAHDIAESIKELEKRLQKNPIIGNLS